MIDKDILKKVVSSNFSSLLIISLLFVFPAIIGRPYWVSIFTVALIWAIFAISYDIVFGQTGILSFGHTAPFGLAAFVAAYLMFNGFPFIIALMMGIVVGMTTNVLMGLPVRRVRGVYYAILTLAFAEVARISIDNLARYIGTSIAFSAGYPQIVWSEIFYYFNLVIVLILLMFIVWSLYIRVKEMRRVSIGDAISIFISILIIGVVIYGFINYLDGSLIRGFRILTINFYFLTLIFFIISYYIARRIISSPVGSVWRAIRENPMRTEMLGYNIYTYRLYSLAVSGALAGVAGTLFAATTVVNTETALSAMNTLIVLLSVILGGAGTLIGPALGMLIVQILRYFLASAPIFSYASMAIIGFIYIIVVLLFPYGIVGSWYLKAIRLRRKIMRVLSRRIWSR